MVYRRVLKPSLNGCAELGALRGVAKLCALREDDGPERVRTTHPGHLMIKRRFMGATLTTPPHITEPQSSLGFNFDLPIVLDIPVGCGREHVAAMIEAITGRSLLGPHYPRAGRQERARRVAEIRAVLGRIQPARKPRKEPPLPAAPILRTPATAAQRCSTKEAVAILGLPARTIQHLAARGELTDAGAAKVGRRWTFDREKLRRFVKRKEQETWQNAKHRPDVSGGRLPPRPG